MSELDPRAPALLLSEDFLARIANTAAATPSPGLLLVTITSGRGDGSAEVCIRVIAVAEILGDDPMTVIRAEIVLACSKDERPYRGRCLGFQFGPREVAA